jgi:hypothetical protein
LSGYAASAQEIAAQEEVVSGGFARIVVANAVPAHTPALQPDWWH